MKTPDRVFFFENYFTENWLWPQQQQLWLNDREDPVIGLVNHLHLHPFTLHHLSALSLRGPCSRDPTFTELLIAPSHNLNTDFQ